MRALGKRSKSTRLIGHSSAPYMERPAGLSRLFRRHRPAAAIAALVLVLSTLGACQPAKTERQLYVFGTVVTITIADAQNEQANAALDDVERLFRELHTELHPWQDGGLMQFNQALAKYGEAQAGTHIDALLKTASSVEQATAGLFNAAIGKTVNAWGFHTSNYPIRTPAPSESQLQALLAQDYSASQLARQRDGTYRLLRRPAPRFDFSGLAKGYALKEAAERLRDRGIENALLDAGGDLLALGRPTRDNWRIAIRPAFGGDPIGVLAVRPGEAVMTSGNYERYREDASERAGHILDPRTGRPTPYLASATVLMLGDAGRADALATALVVAGPERFFELVQNNHIEYALLQAPEGEILMTEGMRRRLQKTAD